MASWSKTFIYVPKYEYTSCNQHGERFKRKGSKQLSRCKITVDRTDAEGLLQLTLLSHHLDTPVRYDFESKPQTAFIEIISAEKLQQK